MEPDTALCPRCFDDPALDGELLKNAVEYAMSLAQEVCVEQEEYERRLGLCQACAWLKNGVCMKCGCFVIVRARRKGKACPLYAAQWP